MDDHTALDAAIIDAIKAGRSDFHRISTRVLDESRKFETPLNEPWRITDRRLQALRKAGRIHYTRKTGWKLGDGQ